MSQSPTPHRLHQPYTIRASKIRQAPKFRAGTFSSVRISAVTFRGVPRNRGTRDEPNPERNPAMKSFVATLVLSALALVFFPTPVAAEDVEVDSSRYGAIAYSLKTGKFGYAWNYGSRHSAETAALSECPESDA